jgi:hypothetical protein
MSRGAFRMSLSSIGLADEFLAPRRCMRLPIDEIFDTAQLLDHAADAHLAGDHLTAEVLLKAADNLNIRAWTESLWGAAKANPDQWRYHRFRQVPGAPPVLPKEQRVPKRMPSAIERTAVVECYGWNCVFCGIPLISKEIRSFLQRKYPSALTWGVPNNSQHAAFQCMWTQFDHVLPHSRGGDNSLENVIITCAPCNFGRMERTLEEVGLIDPRTLDIHKTSWDGLGRVLGSSV